MKIIGLTGGIASGKSTVSNLIREYRIPIIDADIIARTILEPGSNVLSMLCHEFGSIILNDDHTLNRKKLGEIVFNSAHELQILNSITHPVIRERIKDKLNAYKISEEKFCIIDAAVLIEGRFTDLVDYIILVYVEDEIQIERLMLRDKISRAEACKRINAQMSFDEKKKYANYIIDNSKTIEFTKIQLKHILSEIFDAEGINV